MTLTSGGWLSRRGSGNGERSGEDEERTWD